MEELKKITTEEAYRIRKQILRSYPDFDDLPWQRRAEIWQEYSDCLNL